MSNQLADALRNLMELALNGESVLFTAEYDRARESLAAHEDSLREEAAKPAEPDLLACDIQPRPLSHSLSDYHRAMSEGPLHYTWQDKPHRLVYDLIAAVRYYAAPVAVASPWLPIETAPKDGTTVLTFRLLNGEPQICDARYFALGDAWGQRSWRYPSETGPAHWMPLPPAPEMKP